jgi:hypothetical protein
MMDQEGTFIIANLMAIIAEEMDEIYPDHMLLSDLAYVYDGLSQGVRYLSANGVEPPLEVLHFLARFNRAAMEQSGGGDE